MPAGFMLFVALTVLTIYAQPAPLKLGAHKLAVLEERVLAAGRAGWQVCLHGAQKDEDITYMQCYQSGLPQCKANRTAK